MSLDPKPSNKSNFRLTRASMRRKTRASQRFKEPEVVDERVENLKKILANIYDNEDENDDERDVSQQPSFSKFQLPYCIKCRSRYNNCKKLYEQRFKHEIEQLIAQQANGYEAARLCRHLCITTFWPPLHSRAEIAHTQRYFFTLTNKERKRLNWIMTTNII